LISVNIICRNEEKNIEDCLKSVLWADEIIVVDAESADRTLEIAKKYTDKVFVNKWEGFAKQRTFALEKSKKDWVLALDADERCSSGLKEEIVSFIASNNHNIKGFKLPRQNYFLGKWIKYGGWYPGYQLRFFKRSNVKVSDRLVHEGYEVDGDIGVMKNDIIHYTVQSVFDFMNRVNGYSNLQAEEKSKNRNIGFLDIFIQPLKSFVVQYIFKGGFRDGLHGLMVYNFDAITRMLTYMKIWEKQNKGKSKL
jgi:glycosyltransferase involved in cell wall biosynthesis